MFASFRRHWPEPRPRKVTKDAYYEEGAGEPEGETLQSKESSESLVEDEGDAEAEPSDTDLARALGVLEAAVEKMLTPKKASSPAKESEEPKTESQLEQEMLLRLENRMRELRQPGLDQASTFL